MLDHSQVYSDSLLHGDDHTIRLTHGPTGVSIESEIKLPKDRRDEAILRQGNWKKAWEMLAKEISK